MTSPKPPCRVLCVEDDPLQRQALLELLKILRVTAEAAPDIATARELLASRSYDLVLADYNLPDGTADDLLADARWQARTVVVSANPISSRHASGGPVVAKPLTRAKLERILREGACSPEERQAPEEPSKAP
ncbi:MAG: response regulator [Acidobacteria bacterium]|nr:response regulator [Acidobacteriota bacterium]